MEKNQLVPMGNNMMSIIDEDNRVINYQFDVFALEDAQSNYLQLFAPGVTIAPDDMFNAIQSPAKTVGESIGDTFNLVGVVAHAVEVVNENTGELIPCPRIILFGSKGETFVSVSKTMFSSLKNLFGLYKSVKDWQKTGIPIKLKQFQKGEKRYFSIEIMKTK